MEHEFTKNCKISDKKQRIIGWTYKTDEIFHLGHFTAIVKILDFLKNGDKVKILLQDCKYNLKNETIKSEKICSTLLKIFSVVFDRCDVEFIKASDLRNNERYVKDFYKLISVTNDKDVLDLIKDQSSVKMIDLVNVVCKILDNSKIEVDEVISDNPDCIKLGKKILQVLDHNGYKIIGCNTIKDFKSNRMSSMNLDAAITIFDTEKNIKKKINKYFCEEGNLKTEILSIFKFIIFPFYNLKYKIVELKTKAGETFNFDSYNELEKKFEEKKIHPGDLKESAYESIKEIFKLFGKVDEEDKKAFLNLLK